MLSSEFVECLHCVRPFHARLCASYPNRHVACLGVRRCGGGMERFRRHQRSAATRSGRLLPRERWARGERLELPFHRHASLVHVRRSRGEVVHESRRGQLENLGRLADTGRVRVSCHSQHTAVNKPWNKVSSARGGNVIEMKPFHHCVSDSLLLRQSWATYMETEGVSEEDRQTAASLTLNAVRFSEDIPDALEGLDVDRLGALAVSFVVSTPYLYSCAACMCRFVATR